MDFEAYSSFIEKNLNSDVHELALKQSKIASGLNITIALEQISLLKKSKSKLPTFYESRCFFTNKSFEQSTSEEVAKFKASLFSGDLLIDLSGGLGVDDWAFASTFNKVVSLDPNEDLNKMVRYNFSKLGKLNIERITGIAEDYISKIPINSTIYVDPDRRDEKGNKHFLPENCLPNILEIVPLLLNLNCTVIVKLSPMFDISEIIRKLNFIDTIYAIASRNEMKEILVVCNKNFNFRLNAVNIISNEIEQFTSTDHSRIPENAQDEEAYFYEPNSALIKLNIWKEYAATIQLKLYNPNTAFLCGSVLINNFQGRKFKIIASFQAGTKALQQYFKKNNIAKANISTRNYFYDANTIRKKIRLEDGGQEYLFFFKNEKNKATMVHAHKV